MPVFSRTASFICCLPLLAVGHTKQDITEHHQRLMRVQNEDVKSASIMAMGQLTSVKASSTCQTYDNWRKNWGGGSVEIPLTGAGAYGAVVSDWSACLAACQNTPACRQVVMVKSSKACYGMNAASDEDQDGAGGTNKNFISAHCNEAPQGGAAPAPNGGAASVHKGTACKSCQSMLISGMDAGWNGCYDLKQGMSQTMQKKDSPNFIWCKPDIAVETTFGRWHMGSTDPALKVGETSGTPVYVYHTAGCCDPPSGRWNQWQAKSVTTAKVEAFQTIGLECSADPCGNDGPVVARSGEVA